MDYKEGLSTREELVGLSNNNVNDATHIAKGKRTKRLRLLSNMTSSCSSASGGSGGGDDQGSFSISSTTTTTDQEEEDMANCLILLAQGGRDSHHHHQQQQEQQENQKQQADEDHDDHGDGDNKAEINSRKFSEMGATNNNNNNNNKVGFYIYECKTCNRTFPSFQALGGHRASHKKPKLAMAVEEKKPPPPAQPAPVAPPSPPPPPPPPSSQPQIMMNTNYDHHHRLEFEAGERKPHIKSVPPNPISLQLGSAQKAKFTGNNKAKIHECSICGSEFTSGQALGGHMRRHRASTNASTQPISSIEATCNAAAAAGAAAVVVEVQPRNILELDLNLPAPEEDLREPKFQFTAATKKSMVLSAAPALVDCHY